MDGFREAFLGLRVSPQTVTSVRTNLETDAQFEHLQSRVTADGKTRVIRKPSPTPTPALSPPPIAKEAPPAAPITVEEAEAVEAVRATTPPPAPVTTAGLITIEREFLRECFFWTFLSIARAATETLTREFLDRLDRRLATAEPSQKE